MIKITLPDGKVKKYESGITGNKLVEDLKIRDVLAVKVNDKVQDLFKPIEEDAAIKLLKFSDPEGKDVFRHSTAHIFAHAIKHLYPDAKPTIGPPVEEGFYYDFDDLNITPNDFPKIEAKMREIIKNNFPYEYQEVTIEEVKKQFWNNSYKVELAEEFAREGQKLTIYKEGDFIDLCAGPHIPNTNLIKAFKLAKVAGAYWRGNAKNKQLTRVYGISFPSQKELDEHFRHLEEAEKRDHRKIGTDLKLFTFSENVGMGLPLWLPKGETVRNEIMKFMREKEEEQGYKFVWTPHITLSNLYLASGHLPYYTESMYPPMKDDNQEYYLKPMNCPHHHMIYQELVTSYRDLPLKLAEEGTVYRKELAGVSSGLMRVRSMTMNDAHIYVTSEQLENEFTNVLQLFKEIYEVFGIQEFYYRLSLPDFEKNPEKYAGDKHVWEKAAESIRSAMKKFGANFIEATGEAAFYGPKIDVQRKNIHGKEETIATSQIDILVPQRMNLEYTDENNTKKNPLIIHRAIIGTYERFMAFLIEHFAGKFPLWLSPEQVRILTIADRFNEYANAVADQMKEQGIRANVDGRSESIGKKIREAQLQQVNYILVVGEKELNDKTINVRTRDNVVHGAKKVDKFIEQLVKEIKEKK